MRSRRHLWLGAGLVALGAAMALLAVLGPLVLGVIRYRTSPTSMNQIVGSDAAGLFLVAPFSVAVGVLVLTGRRLARLGLAPAVYAAYICPQLALGNEFQARAGNVERFFPLLLGVFVLAVALVGGLWRATAAEPASASSRRRDRVTGVLLLVAAAVVTVGLHLPTYLDALSASPTNVGYLTSPTAFWLVKFMDVGIVVPAALAIGVGLLSSRPWAGRAAQAILGAYAFLATSVSGMAIAMYANDDPDASVAQVVVASTVALALLGSSVELHRATTTAAAPAVPVAHPAARQPIRSPS